jgi:hypothetical protein
MDVERNLALVRNAIERAARAAGRASSEVRLVGVSKRQPIERVAAAYELGLRDFGENYVQELVARRSELPREARWHMIGHLQTNKAKQVLAADWLHGVDSMRLVEALTKAGAARSEKLPVLVEVNLAGEASKSGAAPADVEVILLAAAASPCLDPRGLMCIPPPGGGRPWFAKLRGLRDEMASKTGLSLPELSMGMSSDFEDAILEGSTMVRVGTAIFGEREEKRPE